MDERLQALKVMKELAAKYVAGDVAFAEFFPALSKLLGAFDPFEPSLAGLPGNCQAEARFFSAWTGGEFGEFENRIPRNPNWRYGIDTTMYSWVDQKKYRESFSQAYSHLLETGDAGLAV